MQSNSEGYFDILELAKELRSEKLFIQSELELIRNLNDRLEKSAVQLAQATWTSTQQRSNTKQLFAQGDPSSSTCCQRIDCILAPVFVDAHKVLRYQDALVLSDLIQRVRASPTIVSLWLAAAELQRPTSAAAVARALCGGLYVYDVSPLRRVLYHLAKHRLAVAEDPRRIISQGSSSFSRLYCELVDGFRPARLFLAAALKGPMLPLLQIDECLVIDPEKALERVKKLIKNNPANPDCQQQLYRYRKWTISTLVTSTVRFVNSLREIWMCFPPTIAWVVRQTALVLQTNQTVSEEDIYSICTDLVFTNFICQAIIHPEAYGITDVPITNISRFNLVQVAQTIQSLCLMKNQEVDGKFRDFYLRFEKDSVYSLLDMILENESYSAVPNGSSSFNGSEAMDMEDVISEVAACESEERDTLKMEPTINPNIALFTRNDLHLLVSLLKIIPTSSLGTLNSLSDQVNCMKSSNSKQEIELLLDIKTKDTQSSSENLLIDQDKKSLDEGCHSDNEMACGVSTFNDNIKSENKSLNLAQDEEFSLLLKNINPDHILNLKKLLEKLPDSSFNWENTNGQKVNGSSLSKGKSSSSNSPIKNGPKNRNSSPQSQEVLVIKLSGDTPYEPIGLVTECKVLEYHYSTMVECRTLSDELLQQTSGLPNSRSMELLELPRPNTDASPGTSHNNPTQATSSGPHPGQEKRTRFSLSHDEGSIGNTSDNLEAVSEAASNHSVTSSLEMETEDQNDNLSDMVSANVSGRGSPNISGRDTPSSQVTEGDAGVSSANPQPPRHPSVTLNSSAASKQAKLLKRTRHDIEDKFCKFEIKKLIEGDETISIISDTWSTDVLASDSETIGESTYDRTFIATHFGQHAARVVAQQAMSVVIPPQPDASETASESAWSTDVLVSDADRMTEVDIDDCNSVARSDTDTARSEGEITSASMANTSQPSLQLSPLNNMNPDIGSNIILSCNSSNVHIAHSIDVLSTTNNLKNTVPSNSNMNATDRNVRVCENISPAILITQNTDPIGLPEYENANISRIVRHDVIDNNINIVNIQNMGIIQGGIRPESYQGRVNKADDELETNRSIELNGYPVFPSTANLNSNLESTPAQGMSHSTIDTMSPYKYANGKIAHASDRHGFDFVAKRKGTNNPEQSINSMPTNILSSDTLADTASSSFVSNGNATIRWLNDPCQKFPLCPDSDQSPSNNATFFDYDTANFSSCPDVLNTLCKKVENINLNETESIFRPIKLEDSVSTVNILPNKSISNEEIFNIERNFNEERAANTKNKNIHKKNALKQYDDIFSASQYKIDKVSLSVGANSSIQTNPFVARECKSSPHNSYSSNFNENTPIPKSTEIFNNTSGSSLKQLDNKSPNKLIDEKNDSPINDVNSSGSAISLSTLSVNSVDTSTSEKSSSQEVNSENLTERRITPPLINNSIIVHDMKNQHISSSNDGANTLPRQSSALGNSLIKPGSSTGAIPKSISFDSTAEKRYHSGRRIVEDASEGISINFGEFKNNVKRSGGNLLNKIKLFRNKNKGQTGAVASYGKRSNQDVSDDLCKLGRESDVSGELNQNETVNAIGGISNNNKQSSELSDDILAKYRRKASSSSDAANSDSTSHSGSTRSKNRGTLVTREDAANVSDADSALGRNSDMEFENLRRELRLVLSNMEVHNLELASGCSGSLALACALRLEGAGGALGALCALGNLGTLNSSRGSSLLSTLRTDSVTRRPYISYLAKCRRSLLSTIAALESECVWQTNEAQRQSALAASTRARTSLAAREPRLAALQEKLRSGLADERREALAAALYSLASEMSAEDAWAGASEWELEQAALTIERVVMGRVYIQAMFPNSDGDIMRDQLLHDHMAKLGANGIGLPAGRLAGAPWTPAQRILAHLPAYKTPRDKVDCIVCCVNSIITLLSMSSDGSTPGADDLTPVLVYILIKTNPPSLLSTVQFVTTFVTIPLEGERLYCWTQFCAAIEYIKTMD